jgi:hypothetical protein
MIFATLASLLLFSSSSALSTEGVTTSSSVSKNALKKELEAKIREKLVANKVAKFSKLKSKASKLNLETTTFDEANVHMRGLKMKNNFLVMNAFEDDQCTVSITEYGSLVNYCMDQENEESGVKKSYITKVNKKENLFVEIEYDGFGCKVISDPKYRSQSPPF